MHARLGRTIGLVMVGAALAATGLQAQQPAPRPDAAEVQRASRGWIGIYLAPDAPDGDEIRVERVAPESPAARAGIRAGDRIVRWNGRTDVRAAIRTAPTRPGDTVRIRVRREGERDRDLALAAAPRPPQVVQIVPGERGREVVVIRPGVVDSLVRMHSGRLRLHLDSLAIDADSLHRRLRLMLTDSLGPALRELERIEIPEFQVVLPGDGERLEFGGTPFAFFEMGARGVAGAEFSELNPALGDYFGTATGVLVLRIAPDTPAARAGLRPGDVVVEAGGRTVRDLRDLRYAVGRADGEVVLTIVRKGERRELRLEGKE